VLVKDRGRQRVHEEWSEVLRGYERWDEVECLDRIESRAVSANEIEGGLE
jgi:hypothetical protein